MRALWLMIAHPLKTRRYLHLEILLNRGVRLSAAAKQELASLRDWTARRAPSRGDDT